MSWHHSFTAAYFYPPVVTRAPVDISISALLASPPVPTFEQFMRRYEHTPSPNIALRL